MSSETEPEIGANNHNAIYLLRTAQQHHVQLSAMADQKANFLLAGSFVAFSVVASGVSSGQVGLTMLALSLTSVVASFFAVLAVMPRFVRHPKNRNERNLLFFGEIGDLEFEDYWEKLKPTLSSSEDTLRTMAKDIYEIGRVLRNKKYRYLQWSYRSFFAGLLITAIAFVVEQFSS